MDCFVASLLAMTAEAPQFVILYPVAFTIGCQNAVLAASSFVRPSGVEPTGIRPIAASFSFTSGLASRGGPPLAQLLRKSRRCPRRQPHAVPAVRHQIDAALL